MKLDTYQLNMLEEFKSTIKKGDDNERNESVKTYIDNIYSHIAAFLESKPYHIVFDNLNMVKLRVDGYLCTRSGYICPLICNHTYILRSLYLKNGELTLSNDKVGFIYSESKCEDFSKSVRVKRAVSEYNKKVSIAISQYPSAAEIFNAKFIDAFKLL